MLKSIFDKTLYERRWFVIAWAIGIFAMTVLTMSFYPFFKDSGFDQIIADAPKSLQSLLGQAENYKSVTGYVAEQIFALRLPALVIIMAVALFVGISATDESRGTLETLLAQPVSRAKVYWQKFWAATLIMALASVVIFFAVWASFPIINGSMDLGRLAQACLACWLVSMTIGSLAYCIGAATGKRGLSIGIASGVAFLSFLISSMAPAVTSLEQVQKASVFYYYNVPSVASNGLNFTNVLALVAIIAVFSIVGLIVFLRRDLVRD